MEFKANAQETAGANLVAGSGLDEALKIGFHYEVACYDSLGNLKWQDRFDNLVTTVGKNDLLDVYFGGGTQDGTWFFGLIDGDSYTTGPAAGDTMASHGGWVESQEYTQGTRPAITFAAAAAGSKATSGASVFSINATTVIKGAFVAADSTKGGTTGILYSAGLFTGGDRSVQNGDTLNVSGSWSV